MTRHTVSTRWVTTTVIALAFGVMAPGDWAAAEDHDEDEILFADADILFELNDTDGDLGIHALIDGEPWKRLRIEDPYGRSMLGVSVNGLLRWQGLTELFFESAEPTFDELAPEDFFRRFPEGEYEVEGRTLEGQEIEGESELSHVIPAPAGNLQINGVDVAEDCDVVPLPAVSPPVVISWDSVVGSHPDLGKAGAVEVDKYEVVIEGEDVGLTAELPPDAVSFELPEDVTDLGDTFKLEILVQADTGNRTATETCFDLQ